jgi:hypothetical protein
MDWKAVAKGSLLGLFMSVLVGFTMGFLGILIFESVWLLVFTYLATYLPAGFYTAWTAEESGLWCSAVTGFCCALLSTISTIIALGQFPDNFSVVAVVLLGSALSFVGGGIVSCLRKLGTG